MNVVVLLQRPTSSDTLPVSEALGTGDNLTTPTISANMWGYVVMSCHTLPLLSTNID